MRVKDLYSEVARLGFETLLEDSTGFCHALNRALMQIASIRPEIRSVTVVHEPLCNLLDVKAENADKKSGGTELTYTASSGAVAYSFECDGVGSCSIYALYSGVWEPKGGPITLKSTHGLYKTYRGVIECKDASAVRLCFHGDYTYFVKNPALWDEIFSGNGNDVPAFSAFVKYDIANMVGDFLGFEAPPIKSKNGFEYLGNGYRIESGRVLVLPYEARGSYDVQYKHKPTPIDSKSPATDETEIDLDDECASLLPLLVAAYIWLEDEPEKASYYMDLYRERATEIRAYKRNFSPAEYVTNGW